MKILIVEDDDAVLSFSPRNWEPVRSKPCRCTLATVDWWIVPLQERRPMGIRASDYRFVPATKIKDGVQLVTAIHEINPLQRTALMTAEPKEARENCPMTSGACR
jgi:hypothetical protein